jgi:hypothetical protein
LLGKPEEKMSLGTPRHRWKGNIKIDLREICCWDVDWIHLAQDGDNWRAVTNAVINLRVLYKEGNFLTPE